MWVLRHVLRDPELSTSIGQLLSVFLSRKVAWAWAGTASLVVQQLYSTGLLGYLLGAETIEK